MSLGLGWFIRPARILGAQGGGPPAATERTIVGGGTRTIVGGNPRTIVTP